MSGRQNKFRKTAHSDKGNIWQRVVKTYQHRGPFKKDVDAPMYEDADAPQDSNEEDPDNKLEIPYCSIISYLLYLIIFALIFIPCLLMWVAQPHPNPQSRLTEDAAPNISERISQAKNEPIIFTEDEINRYLEQECNIIQQGGYSILAHPESIMVRIHDGYAQIIIDRMLGIDFHHTVTINLSFERIEQGDHSSIACHLHGGPTIWGSLENGGAIGSMPIPERFMQMMVPALKRLLRLHPEIRELVEERAYLPEFKIDEKGMGFIQFTPPNQQIISTNNESP